MRATFFNLQESSQVGKETTNNKSFLFVFVHTHLVSKFNIIDIESMMVVRFDQNNNNN